MVHLVGLVLEKTVERSEEAEADLNVRGREQILRQDKPCGVLCTNVGDMIADREEI